MMRLPKKDLDDLDKFSIYEKKRRKRAYGRELKNIHDTKILNSMNIIHNNKVNNIAECNLLHGIINISKRTKI